MSTPPDVISIKPAATSGELNAAATQSTARSRRDFLKAGVTATAALAAPVTLAAASSAPLAPTPPFTPYGNPVDHEQGTSRRIAANRDAPGNGVALTPLEDLAGTITPSGLHYERHHSGVPALDPARHRVTLTGMVRQPLAFDIAHLLRYPMTSSTLFIECSGNSNSAWHHAPMQRPVGSMHGLVSCSEWSGVPLSLLLDEAGTDPAARWAIVEGADGMRFNVSIPLNKLRDDCFLALFQNGERLRAEQGYPVRLIVPGWRGHLHVKWIHRIELTDRPVMSRNDTTAYSALMPDGSSRQFDHVVGVKSVITTPTHGQTVAAGPVVISGLAWSGHGAIRAVDVSLDGGQRWQPATLQTPVLPRAFCRFQFNWKRGEATSILQSRATDEQGNVQPSRAALLAERGNNGYVNFNGIVSWQVDEDGSVSHVYA